MQLFNWTRNPSRAFSIARRKEEIYDQLMEGMHPVEAPHVRSFLDTLRTYKVCSGRGRVHEWSCSHAHRANYCTLVLGRG